MGKVQAWCHKLAHAMLSWPCKKFLFVFLFSFPVALLLTTLFSCLAYSFSFLPLSPASLSSRCFFCACAGTADGKVPPRPCWSRSSSQKAAPCQRVYRPIPAWTHFLKLVWWHPHPLMSPSSKEFQYLPQAGEHLMTSSWSVLLLKKEKKRCR